MTYKPSIQEIADTKMKLSKKGIYWPDSKIQAYLVQEDQNTKWEAAKPQTIMPSDVMSKDDDGGGVAENLLDAVGNLAWNL